MTSYDELELDMLGKEKQHCLSLSLIQTIRSILLCQSCIPSSLTCSGTGQMMYIMADCLFMYAACYNCQELWKIIVIPTFEEIVSASKIRKLISIRNYYFEFRKEVFGNL